MILAAQGKSFVEGSDSHGGHLDTSFRPAADLLIVPFPRSGTEVGLQRGNKVFDTGSSR